MTEPQLFSGDLRPYPGIPESWPRHKREDAERILCDVRRLLPGWDGHVEDGADMEDFWEDACRISAAWRATGGDVTAKRPGTLDEPWTADEMARRFGPLARGEEGGHHAPDRALMHPLVVRHGGRGMFLGSSGREDETDVCEWLAARHREHGVQLGVVKAAARKIGVWAVELDDDPEVVRERLLAEMDWTYVRLEGQRDSLLAQEAIDMQWEYRLFVVDGTLVTGAGCIEEHTPLDRIAGVAFDTRVRRHRGHLGGTPSDIEDRPDLVHSLLDFGLEMAEEHGGTTVIDVALNAATGTPVVVELNDLPNSGLYASDHWATTRALIGARDRGYLT